MTDDGTPVRIRHFTDPGCPFAFSAERQRLRLRWLYGSQLSWSTHMVVLAETPPAHIEPERMAQSRRRMHERYGMPMAWTPPPRSAAPDHPSPAGVAGRRRIAAAPPARPLLRRPRARRPGDDRAGRGGIGNRPR
jgi:hypothetical protein